MANTIIIKSDGMAINSVTHFDYSIVVKDLSWTEPVEEIDRVMLEQQYVTPVIELRAVSEPSEGGGGRGEDIRIATFYELPVAYQALEQLVSAIENEHQIFDVNDYGPEK